eukprot:3060028-Pleurochrysis_carterae.AAC.1
MSNGDYSSARGGAEDACAGWLCRKGDIRRHACVLTSQRERAKACFNSSAITSATVALRRSKAAASILIGWSKTARDARLRTALVALRRRSGAAALALDRRSETAGKR